MAFLLLVTLLFIVLLVYVFNDLDILSPSIISISMYIFSLLIVLINSNYWNETISAQAVVIVLLGISSFVFGEVSSTLVYKNLNRRRTKNFNRDGVSSVKEIVISRRKMIIIVIFVLVVEYLYFKYMLNLAFAGGYGLNGRSFLSSARLAMLNTDIYIAPSWFLKLGKAAVKAIAFITIFIMVNNKVFLNKKVKLRYIIPNLLYAFQSILSTGRTEIIYYIVYILMLIFIAWKIKNGWSRKLDGKIIKYGLSGIVVFLVIFRLLGYLTGKSEYLSLWDNLSIYIGSPIIALSKYLDKNITNSFFGEETLNSVYGVLRYLGFDFPRLYVPLEDVFWNNVKTNIYTSLRRYLQDYTLFGMIIIQYFLGLFYGTWFNSIRYKMQYGFSLILFAKLFFPVVESVIEERFFNIVLTTGMFYDIAMLYIIYILLIKKNIRKNEERISTLKKVYS